jgi:putative NADPH-quinone reductase
MTRKILLIDGHPDSESYCAALGEAYQAGAVSAGATPEVINIRELNFNPNLRYGYRQRTELEPDLCRAQELITWADHLVWVYPVWWGSLPAITKGFIDRVFLPGFAFKKREGSVWWDKFLTGKSARLICTLDQPGWYYRWVYGRPSHNAMKKLTLQFVGVKKVKTTTIGPIRHSTEAFRQQWLGTVEKLGKKQQ